MQVTILTFGATRDILGVDRMKRVIEPGLTVESLKQDLQNEFPRLVGLNSLFIAVNEEYAKHGTVLQDGDEVALIPPVSGG